MTESKVQRDPREWEFARRYYTPPMTVKMWRFCMSYVGESEFDATDAILRNYGNGSPHASDDETVSVEQRNTISLYTARSMGTQNLAKGNVSECISDLLVVTSMPREEVLNRITRMARANVDDLIEIDANNKPVLNLRRAKQRGALYLIKKLTYDSYGNIKNVELHDSFAALVKLGQHHRLFDRQQEQPTDPRDLARELLEELRANHGDSYDDAVLVSKVLARFEGQGVTASDLVENIPEPTDAEN